MFSAALHAHMDQRALILRAAPLPPIVEPPQSPRAAPVCTAVVVRPSERLHARSSGVCVPSLTLRLAVCGAQPYVQSTPHLARKTVTHRGSVPLAQSSAPPPPPQHAAGAATRAEAPAPRAAPSQPQQRRGGAKRAAPPAAAPASGHKRAKNERRNDLLSKPLPCPYCEAPCATANRFHSHKSRCKKRQAAGA